MLQDLQKQTNDYNQKQKLPQRINFGLEQKGKVDETNKEWQKIRGSTAKKEVDVVDVDVDAVLSSLASNMSSF